MSVRWYLVNLDIKTQNSAYILVVENIAWFVCQRQWLLDTSWPSHEGTGVLAAGRAGNICSWRHPGGIQIRCLNHLDWRLSEQSRSSSTQTSRHLRFLSLSQAKKIHLWPIIHTFFGLIEMDSAPFSMTQSLF